MIRRTADLMRQGLQGLLIAMITVLLTVLVATVVLRYGFRVSLIWGEEMARHLLIWATFAGAVLAYERGELVAVTLLRDALPRRAGLVLAMAANAMAIGLLVTLIHYGLRFAERVGHQPIGALRFLLGDIFGAGTPAPSLWWVYVALPVGMGLLVLRLAVDILLYVQIWREGGRASDLRAERMP